MHPAVLIAVVALATQPPTFAARPEASDPKILHAATRNVAIVLYQGVEVLDFSGPTEVFASAGRNAFNVYTVAASTDPLTSQGIVKVTPQYTFANCPTPDIVVVPGGGGSGPEEKAIVEFLRRVGPQNEITMTVCTGAFYAADAGLLDGRAVTTHWSGIASLRRAHPSLDVKENVRFVDTGNVVTSAGVSAGIDGALHVVDRLLGRKAAERTARYMEYRWQPEEPGVAPTTPARRALEAWHARDAAGAAEAYAAYVKDHADDAIAQYRLGVALTGTGKNEDAIAPLKAALALGYTDARGDLVYAYLALKKPAEALPLAEAATADAKPRPRDVYNLACTYAVLGKTDKALDALERALKLGFMSSMERIRDDEDLASLRDNPRFKSILAGLKS